MNVRASIGVKTTMGESLLTQASAWGFVCQCNLDGIWQIIPKSATEEWKLQQVESRWLLLIRDLPQVSFLPEEAQAFLSRRRSKLEKFGSTPSLISTLNYSR